MLVCLHKKVAFLSMPKCASTSIENVLFPYSQIAFTGYPKIKHVNYKGYVSKVEPIIRSAGVDPKSITTFCLFREPLEWLKSWYRYRAREELSNPNNPRHKNYTGNISFQEFVEGYINGSNEPWAKIGRQSNFISDREGNVGVDKIFRLDQQDLVEEFLGECFDSKINIPRKNVSPKAMDYNLDPRVEEEVTSFLKREYEIYESL